MIKLLVADDHEIFIDGLRSVFHSVEDIVIAATANNGLEVLKTLKNSEVDIVLLDISMPEMDGVECAKKMNTRFPDVKVIILSQFSDEKLVKRLIKYNIKGYLDKSAGKEDILMAIREVFQGGIYYNEQIFDNSEHAKHRKSRFDFFNYKLSKREREVLDLICCELSNKEIAERLELSRHTIETIRSRLMTKTGTVNTAGLVKWAIENDMIDTK